MTPRHNRWLNWFAIFTALSTLALIALGGLVTSKGVGMAVPDWPTTYGYNMFWFPVSKWVGGIFYEHTHRLVASFVGTLVVALTRWVVGRAACKPLLIIGAIEVLAGLILSRFSPQLSGAGYFLLGIGSVVLLSGVWLPGVWRFRMPLLATGAIGVFSGSVWLQYFPQFTHAGYIFLAIGGLSLLAGTIWLFDKSAVAPIRHLAWLAFVLVQVQGLLGGLRVVLIWDKVGIFHGALAQLFFVVLCVIALLTSRWWLDFAKAFKVEDDRWLRGWLPAVALLIFCQLILGATMRHEHAGLAIPDFPLAYHKIWPAMDPASVQGYNQLRLDAEEANPITAFQIKLQLAHRFAALLILMGVGFCAWTARRQMGASHPLAKFTLAWLGLIGLQVILGATTIWSNKAADIATAHVVVGALSLATGALLTIVAFRVLIPTASSLPAVAPIGAMPGRRLGQSAK